MKQHVGTNTCPTPDNVFITNSADPHRESLRTEGIPMMPTMRFPCIGLPQGRIIAYSHARNKGK
jgi:hypothetical protein